MRSVILAVTALILFLPSGGRAQATRKTTDTSRCFYSAAQAKRGKELYAQDCAQCHGANLKGIGTAPALLGDDFMQDYYSVNDLFIKASVTMPGDNVHGLPTDTYLNIIAYLLQANGLPAGTENLKGDVTAMKRMALMEKKSAKPAAAAADGFYAEEQAELGKGYFRGACSMCHVADPGQPKPDAETLMGLTIPEKGFTTLFNGKDFTGWGFLLGSNCTPRPEGCGQTEPGTTFKVEKGTIICSGTPIGYMYPIDKKYLNFTLRLDYRFPAYPGMKSSDQFYGNSGYLIFMKEHRVFPEMMEIQGMNLEILDVRPSKKSTIFTVDTEARKRAVHPVGEWNTVEIVSKDGQVRSYLNGTLVSTVSHHEYTEAGYIGLQSEGAKIYWRNISIKEE